MQPREVALNEGVNAWALQSDGVEHPRRGLCHTWSGATRPRVLHHRFGDDAANGGDIEELIQLATGSSTARCRQDRIDQGQRT